MDKSPETIQITSAQDWFAVFYGDKDEDAIVVRLICFALIRKWDGDESYTVVDGIDGDQGSSYEGVSEAGNFWMFLHLSEVQAPNFQERYQDAWKRYKGAR